METVYKLHTTKYYLAHIPLRMKTIVFKLNRVFLNMRSVAIIISADNGVDKNIILSNYAFKIFLLGMLQIWEFNFKIIYSAAGVRISNNPESSTITLSRTCPPQRNLLISSLY